jgi:hypothetical protein
MSILTAAIYDLLSNDAILKAMLTTYKGSPAIFTVDPAPEENFSGAYIVTAGEVVDNPFDSKTTQGRDLVRDVRCYAPADGSVVTIEAVAERVRALLHRQALTIDGYHWILSDCAGPVVADEQDAYGRIISLSLKAQKE